MQSIILKGDQASGKTYIAETIASLFDESKVLRISAEMSTLNFIDRKFAALDYELIIFDECWDSEEIIDINQLLELRILEKKIENFKAVIFLTQKTDLKNINGFKIIECNYSSNPNSK